MKKILALVLTLMMVLSLCACGTKENPGTTESGSNLDNYPTGNVSMIVPTAAGTVIDLLTRALVESTDIGGTIVVENIAGASQTIASAEAANRPADGYTLLACANAGLLMQPNIMDLPYSLDSFRHIAMIAPEVCMVVCVRAESDVKNAEDWVNFISSGEPYTYSHGVGAGGLGHLASVQFLPELGSENGNFIAYNGGAETLTALLNGEIDWALVDANDALTKWKSGELIPIVSVSSEPFAGLEEIPCLTDLGVAEETLAPYVAWKWVAVSKDTPDEIVEYLKEKINEAVQSDGYKDYLKKAGLGEMTKVWTENELTETLYNASEVYGRLLTDLGLAG